MHPNILIMLALCALVIILAGNSWRQRNGHLGLRNGKQGMLLGLIVVFGVILALFVFNRH